MTTYQYDAVGNRDWMEIDTNGDNIYDLKSDYTYDNQHRLTDLENSNAAEVLLSGFQYKMNAGGMRCAITETIQRVSDPGNDGFNKSYGYDLLNRLENDSSFDEEDNGYSADYQYDLAGNRLSRVVVSFRQGCVKLFWAGAIIGVISLDSPEVGGG